MAAVCLFVLKSQTDARPLLTAPAELLIFSLSLSLFANPAILNDTIISCTPRGYCVLPAACPPYCFTRALLAVACRLPPATLHRTALITYQVLALSLQGSPSLADCFFTFHLFFHFSF